MRELSLRQDERDQVASIFHRELNLPISESDLPIDRGWECERVVVRAVAGKDESSSSASRGPAVVQNQVMKDFQNSGNHTSQKVGHLEVEAVMGNSLEKLSRYQSALRRDLYRAIEMLRTVQAERRKRRESPYAERSNSTAKQIVFMLQTGLHVVFSEVKGMERAVALCATARPICGNISLYDIYLIR